jgi:hypothetical protein
MRLEEPEMKTEGTTNNPKRTGAARAAAPPLAGEAAQKEKHAGGSAQPFDKARFGEGNAGI